MTTPACNKECHFVFHMTGGHHKTDCDAYAADEATKKHCVCCLATERKHDGPFATAVLLAMFTIDKMPPEFYVEALCTAHRLGFDAMLANMKKRAS